MAEYVLNPDYEKTPIKDLIEKIASDAERKGTIKTIKQKKELEILEVKADKIFIRRETGVDWDVTFDELEQALAILKKGRRINTTTLKTLFRALSSSHVERAAQPTRSYSNISAEHEEYGAYYATPAERVSQRRPHAKQMTVKRNGRKIGRNEPCPCGSGKKYKHCCGR